MYTAPKLFRHRRAVPVGHAGGGVCSNSASTRSRNPVSYLSGLPGRDWSRSPLSPHNEKRLRHFGNGRNQHSQLPSHLLNILALKASQNDPGALNDARLRRALFVRSILTCLFPPSSIAIQVHVWASPKHSNT